MKSYVELKTKFLKKITRKFFRLFSSLNWFEIIPPYEYVQTINEFNVHRYIGLERNQIASWVIVGGYLGNEVPRILRNYPNCKVTIFECSERYLTKLRKRFINEPRVEIVGNAISDNNGRIEFFETNLKGSGSVLKVGDLAKSSFGMEQAEVFTVEAIRLDDYFKDKTLDVLQIDVQGAELKVLKGAVKVLSRTKAIFCEISVMPNLYQGSVTIDDLNKSLDESNFKLVLLGTDFNLTGNALYVKSI